MPHDPYSADPPYLYECVACDNRNQAAQHPINCSACGAQMRTLSIPRD